MDWSSFMAGFGACLVVVGIIAGAFAWAGWVWSRR